MLSPPKKPTGLRKPKVLPLPPEGRAGPELPLKQDPRSKALPQRPLPPPPPIHMSSTLITRRPVGEMSYALGTSTVSASSVSHTPGLPQRLLRDDNNPNHTLKASEYHDLSSIESADGDDKSSDRHYSSSISSSHSSAPCAEIGVRRSVKKDIDVQVEDQKVTRSGGLAAEGQEIGQSLSPRRQGLPPPPPPKHPRRLASLPTHNKRKPVPARPASVQPEIMGKLASTFAKFRSKNKPSDHPALQEEEVQPLPPSHNDTTISSDGGVVAASTHSSLMPPGHSREPSDTPTVTLANLGLQPAKSTIGTTHDPQTGPANIQATEGMSTPTMYRLTSSFSTPSSFAVRQAVSSSTDANSASRIVSAFNSTPQSGPSRSSHQFGPGQRTRPQSSLPRLQLPPTLNASPQLIAQPSPGTVPSPLKLTSPVVPRADHGISARPLVSRAPLTVNTYSANGIDPYLTEAEVTSPRSALWPFDRLIPAEPGTIAPAPPLKPYMTACFAAHEYMRISKNRICPVGCMMCEKMDKEPRWSCTFCNLRCCKDCTRELSSTPNRDLKTCLERIGQAKRLPASVPVRHGWRVKSE
ncbi:MAG: hypothetical protein M1818_004591 [Claussenomyces sp. TS43310]|nr:MAG: hypothetical protein M1818_004591 [Claussenomyces sp. TS43310]